MAAVSLTEAVRSNPALAKMLGVTSPDARAGAPGPRPVVVRLADVEAEEITWLWRPYIPMRKQTILEGDPGLGKTFVALSVTAAVTRGYPLPGSDGVPAVAREPGNVIYMSREDGLSDTLVPRLKAMGADLERVFALTGKRSFEPETGSVDEEGITLADVPIIEQALEDHRPQLLVIDPIQSYLGASVDLHRANETRPVLDALGKVAEKFGCAVLLIRHLSKASQERAIYRGIGSIDIAAAARSILLVAEDPHDKTRRIMAHTKSSLAPKGKSQVFTIDNGQFLWAGVSDLSPDDLLAAPTSSPDERSRLEEAMDFLEEALLSGPRKVKDLQTEAKAAGIEWRTVRRAKDQLGVVATRISEGRSGDGYWQWSLGSKESDEKMTSKDSRWSPCSTSRKPAPDGHSSNMTIPGSWSSCREADAEPLFSNMAKMTNDSEPDEEAPWD